MKHEYKDMKIWHKAREINVLVYNMTASFPKEETYGLTSQMRRAAVSIVSNISEGSAFESDAQVLKYLYISLGSLCEVEAQSYLALDVRYIKDEALELLLKESDQLKRMILAFMKSLKAKNKLNPKFLFIIFLFTFII